MSTSKNRSIGRVPKLLVFGLFGLLAACCLFNGAYGLIIDDVYVVGRVGHGLHVHGVAAWFGAGIDFCLAAFFISFIVRFGIYSSLRRPFFHSFDKWLRYMLYGLVAGFLVALISTLHKR